MSDERTIEEIKERIKLEIPVEEETNETGKQAEPDLIEEMKNLGRQFAEALRSAWNSQERQKIETEVREGLDVFVGELDKAFKELRDSDAAQKAKQEVNQVKGKVEGAELGRKTKTAMAEGLRWLSEEFGNLANQFTPVAKEPDSGEDLEPDED
jgi:soluble cytochrome b562